MQAFISQLSAVPGYATELAHSMLIPTIITAVVFLIALIFTGKIPYVLRAIYVVAAILALAYCFLCKNYALAWIVVISLIVMIVVRLIIHIVRTVRENRRIAVIEKKALAKSAKKRGSWKNKQGYSGEVKPIVAEEYKPRKMSKKEIKDVVENDTMNLPVEEVLAAASVSEAINTDEVKAAYDEAQKSEPEIPQPDSTNTNVENEVTAEIPDQVEAPAVSGDTKPFEL